MSTSRRAWDLQIHNVAAKCNILDITPQCGGAYFVYKTDAGKHLASVSNLAQKPCQIIPSSRENWQFPVAESDLATVTDLARHRNL